jgi:ABC-type Fe3+ transport system permease subunit
MTCSRIRDRIEASGLHPSLSSLILAVSSHPASACCAACLCWSSEQAHSRWKERANYFMLRDAIQRNLRHAGQIALFEKLVC